MAKLFTRSSIYLQNENFYFNYLVQSSHWAQSLSTNPSICRSDEQVEDEDCKYLKIALK